MHVPNNCPTTFALLCVVPNLTSKCPGFAALLSLGKTGGVSTAWYTVYAPSVFCTVMVALTVLIVGATESACGAVKYWVAVIVNLVGEREFKT